MHPYDVCSLILTEPHTNETRSPIKKTSHLRPVYLMIMWQNDIKSYYNHLPTHNHLQVREYNRSCHLCSYNVVETHPQLVLECPLYNSIRQRCAS